MRRDRPRALAPDPEERGTLDDLDDALADALPAVSDEGGTIAPHPLERAPAVLPPASAGSPPAGRRRARGGRLSAAAAALTASRAARRIAGPAHRRARRGDARGALAPGRLAGRRRRGDRRAPARIRAPPCSWPSRPSCRRCCCAAGAGWSLPAAAPLLGLAGLAGAYPAIAGAVRGPWARAALGAAGLWWLLLAEPLLGRDLALGTPPGDAGAVLEALGSSGALLLAPLWAAAAVALPWLVPGRALALDIVGAATWAAGLAAATAAIAERAGLAEPRGLAAGAVVAGVLAVDRRAGADTLDAEHDRA